MAIATSTPKNQLNQLVNPGYYYLLLTVTALTVVANAAFNVGYGLSQGVTLWGALLTGFAFGLGDLILVCIGHLYLARPITKLMGIVAVLGLIVLSVFSATAFLIGQQYAKDNYDVALQRRNVEILQKVYDQHQQLQTGQRLERETAKLTAMVKDRGGDGATAIYHLIAKATAYSTESVTLTVRITWSLVFVLAGIATASHIRDLKAPRKSIRKSSSRTVQDTQTKGEASARYQRLKAQVTAGEIKPSVRSLVAAGGMQNQTAQKYLRAMADEGVITRNGNGYRNCESHEHSSLSLE